MSTATAPESSCSLLLEMQSEPNAQPLTDHISKDK